MDRNVTNPPRRVHRYNITVEWTGNTGSGTSGYRDYKRDHTVAANGKPTIAASSDPAFRGDRTRWNPEELFLASLSTCHQLWYLHLCADAGIVVSQYTDHAEGEMQEQPDGGGRFTRVLLRPEITIRAQDDIGTATRLHEDAHRLCYIANSVNFPVAHQPTIQQA